jgi:CheY-like chemotaxis protein
MHETAEEVTTEKRSILVVDDEPMLASTLALIFEQAGYSARAVFSAEEALASLVFDQPSLVVSDVVMPGMDGIALAVRLRASYPSCRVLLFSGNVDTQQLLEEEALRSGQSFEVLSKPIAPREILSRVALLLRQKSAK